VPIRVLIADASSAVRSQLVSTLRDRPGIEIVGQTTGGEETLRESLRLRPDVLVLDVVHPNTNSITVLEEMRRAGLPTRVVAMSDGTSPHWIRWATEAGAVGHLLKDEGLSEAATIIERVHAGGTPPSGGGDQLASGFSGSASSRSRRRANLLTGREQQVLDLIAQGLTSRSIATHLHISSRTVDAHRASIMKKLQVRSVAELVRYQAARRT
jgi:DNA-binding NarL/FixJ family response regulator